jgi:hypothetical protein
MIQQQVTPKRVGEGLPSSGDRLDEEEKEITSSEFLEDGANSGSPQT